MPDELITRLRAALDTAEHLAKQALILPISEDNWKAEYQDTGWRVVAGVAPTGHTLIVADRLGEQDAVHIAAWKPSRVLSLVARDRALLDAFEEAERYYSANVTAPAGELYGLRTALDGAAEFWLGEDTPK